MPVIQMSVGRAGAVTEGERQESANESRRGEVAEAVWMGLKWNSRADIGGRDIWGIGRWDRERQRAEGEKKRGWEIKKRESIRG